MEAIPVGELHDFLSLVDENPPPWSQDIPDMRNCPEMMCSPFITRILREKGMAVCMDRITGHNDGPGRGMSWRGLLENDGCYSPGEPIACMSEDGVDRVVTDGLYSVCRARFQCYREKRLPVLSDVHLTTLTVDKVMEKACAELTHLLSDPSFPVCGKVTCRHKRMNIIDDCGPGWLLDMYRPEVKVEFYGDTAGYLPERVTCHHVRDVYRLLSALNDAERDIRIRNKGASLRSWWQRFAGRVQR